MSIGVSSSEFSNDSHILSVVFGEQCEYVGENAFANCSNLKKINDNNEIKEIHSSAFANCNNLTNISFPNLNTISGNAFANCSNLQEINLPNVSSIGPSAFNSCSILKSVNLSSEYIVDEYAFENCKSLQNIYLDNCTEIKNSAFKNCSSLSNINFKKCKTIGKNAFANCSGLNTISLSTCEKIQTDAFKCCSYLSNVYINNSKFLCELGNHAFCSCSDDLSQCSNSNITFYIKPEIISMYNSAPFWAHYSNNFITQPSYNQIVYTFNGTENELSLHSDFTTIYKVKDSKKINNSVILTLSKNTTDSDSDNDINKDVYDLDCKIFSDDDRTKLTSIIIPPTCKMIGENVFNGCVNLKTITLSNSLKNINDSAFQDCISLINIELPNTLESIGNKSFYNCESLTSFKLPDNLESIGQSVFGGCKSIEKFDGKFAKYNGNALVFNNSLIAVAPKTNIKYYKISDIDENISHLNAMCFSCCNNIRRVDINLNLNSLENYTVFHNCENLYEVHVEGSVGTISEQKDFISYDDSNHSKVKVIIGTLGGNFGDCYNNFKKDFIQILPKPKDDEIIFCTGKNQSAETISNVQKRDKNIKKLTIHSLTDTCFHSITKEKNFNLPIELFKGLPVTEVLIGKKFTTINEMAFMNCKDLTHIDMANIQNIGNSCFTGCINLTKICMPPNSNQDYFYNTFLGCVNLKEFISYKNEYVSDDNMCYIKNNTLCCFAQGGLLANDGKYTIPNNINKIGYTTFRNCSLLEEININNNVTYIDSFAFEGCINLTTIGILTNSELNTISNYSFKNCTSLTSINLPNKLTSLGVSAFEGCNSLSNVNINSTSSIETIKKRAFYGCSNIENTITIPNTVTTIGESAFEGCEKLTTVSVTQTGSNLNAISDNSFKYCASLTTFTLPNKLTSLGVSAFEGCTQLGSISLSQSASILNTISDNSFKDCTSLTSIKIPYALTSLGVSAFEGCTKLGEINISKVDSKLNAISDNSFKSCTSLTFINIPNSLTSIGVSAFEDCTKLGEISINYIYSNLNTIKDNSFKNCTSLTTMNLPDNLTTIGNSAFEGCSLYKGNYSENNGLGIKENIISIGNRCFYGTNIPKLTIKSTKLTSISESAFEECSELTTVSIATNSQLTTIGKNAFRLCTKLSKFNSGNSGELILPNTIQHIEDGAFAGCDISKINLKNNKSLLDLGNNCFYVNTNNGTRYPVVYVPEISSASSISIFKKDGVNNSGSNPITYGSTIIYVKSNLLTTYQSNGYWIKYKGYMKSY